MKIISLWQPWASLCALGIKKYETRSWGTKYTGPIAIHATKTQPVCVSAALQEIIYSLDERDREVFKPILESLPLPQGCIVGVADAVGCYRMWDREPRTEKQVRTFDRGVWEVLIPAMAEVELACGHWEDGRFAWKLIDCVPTPQIPYKGGQGLRDIKDGSVVEILEQVLASRFEVTA